MTREEAIEILQEEHDWAQEPCYVINAINKAIEALRTPTREQVEKIWRGEWVQKGDIAEICYCSKCGTNFEEYLGDYPFCPRCGAPMTDKAVDMVVARTEALHEEN